jgi:hypothetical protein
MKKMTKIAVAGAATMALLGISVTPAVAAREEAPTYQTMDECLADYLTSTSVTYTKTFGNNPMQGDYPLDVLGSAEIDVYLPCEVYLEKNKDIYEDWKYLYNMAAMSVNISEGLHNDLTARTHYQNQAKRYLSQLYMWGLVPLIDGTDDNTLEALFTVLPAIQTGDLTQESVKTLGVGMIWHMAWLVERDEKLKEINDAVDKATGKNVRKALKKLKLPQVQQQLIFGYLEVLDSTDSLFASINDEDAANALQGWISEEVIVSL